MTGHAEGTVRLSPSEDLWKDVESVMDQVDVLRSHALKNGLSERRLLWLTDAITASSTLLLSLDELNVGFGGFSEYDSMCKIAIATPSAARSLLRCMLPAAQVPKGVVFALCGALCGEDLPVEVKRDILRWLAAVFHTLDASCNRVLLSRVLLGLLDTSLCADAVGLLVLLASRKTATSFAMSCIAKASNRKPCDELEYLAHVFELCRLGSVVPHQAERKNLEAIGLAWQAHMHQLQQDFFGNVVHERRPENLGLCIGQSTGGEQIAEAMEKGALSLTTFLRNPEIQIILASKSDGDLRAYFDGRLHEMLTDLFCNPETANGKELLEMLINAANTWQELPPVVEQWLMEVVGVWDGDHYWEQVLALISFVSLSSPGLFYLCILEPLLQLLFFLELEKQIKIFRCLCNLCRFWGLVEVPRSRGQRGPSLFGRTYGRKPMSALQQLIGQLGHISVALLQLHPDHIVEVMVDVFDLHLMRLDLYTKTGVTLLSALPWPVLVYAIHSRNPLLLDGISKVCLSQQTLLGLLRQKFPQPWLQERIRVCNAQVIWLGHLLTGFWKEACDFGPHLSPAVLKAADLLPSKTGDWPLALWWQPALDEQVSKLCRKHRVERHKIVLDGTTWGAFLTFLASSQSHTAKLMAEITNVHET